MSAPAQDGWYGRFGKRAVDVCGSAVLLVATAPLLFAVALAVALALGRPILFRQERPGQGARPFELFKFRSMAVAGDGDTDDDRLSAFGRWLRRSSLDELPELVNVLRGEMSLVGPRPLLTAYLERYDARQARRHEVRPGITGWAQVHGRNKLDWPERLEMDVWYVDNCSFLLDLRIAARTLGLVLRGSGTSADGHATMPEFRGDDSEPRS